MGRRTKAAIELKRPIQRAERISNINDTNDIYTYTHIYIHAWRTSTRLTGVPVMGRIQLYFVI